MKDTTAVKVTKAKENFLKRTLERMKIGKTKSQDDFLCLEFFQSPDSMSVEEKELSPSTFDFRNTEAEQKLYE